MEWQTRRFLVTIKATPNPSSKYRETVCVGGLDLDSGAWTRLFPVPFRDLDRSKQFKKYTIIEVGVKKAEDDHRPESHKINLESIRLVEHIDTKKHGWARRKEMVEPAVGRSYCEVLRLQAERDLSMGAFRPSDVGFSWSKASVRPADTERDTFAQMSFIHPNLSRLEAVPYNFYYAFRCRGEPECPGHKLPIIDWELSAAWYKWRERYPDEETRLANLKHNWLDVMCSPGRDTVFFVGNTKRFRTTFMIGGVFYPPL